MSDDPTHVSSCGSARRSSTSRGEDERGRHALAGPPEWIAERMQEYADAGCDGFVLNLDYDEPGLEERVARFGKEVKLLLPRREE